MNWVAGHPAVGQIVRLIPGFVSRVFSKTGERQNGGLTYGTLSHWAAIKMPTALDRFTTLGQLSFLKQHLFVMTPNSLAH